MDIWAVAEPAAGPAPSYGREVGDGVRLQPPAPSAPRSIASGGGPEFRLRVKDTKRLRGPSPA